jgi:hypothetical protein
MKELKKARMGMIAVAVVMLKSITRRLTGTRRLSSGMMTMALAGIVLLIGGEGRALTARALLLMARFLVPDQR